jgi:hypothetical protein
MIGFLPGFTTAIDRLLWLAIVSVAVKLLSSGILLVQGNYRAPKATLFSKLVYMSSKVTPVIMVFAFLAAESLRGNRSRIGILTVLAIITPALAIFAVWLRKTGRFFGVAELLTRKPR